MYLIKRTLLHNENVDLMMMLGGRSKDHKRYSSSGEHGSNFMAIEKSSFTPPLETKSSLWGFSRVVIVKISWTRVSCES